ncbi:MAG: aminodeoxychorismate synthase component I [Candidatus Omnitrophica bacterium]|nr:aminodeoxychorismate synthase component I [Candidatus Omnitrophota bacterium]
MQPYLYKSFDFQGDGFDLWECFCDEPRAFFLDSSQYDPCRGRYSLIGFEPFDTFVHKGQEALSLLKKKFLRYSGENKGQFSSPYSPLTSGIVGYLGYDYGLYHEKIRLRAEDGLGLPDAVFGFYDCVLAVDHFTQKLFITSSGLPEKTARLKEQRARQRLNYVVKKIEACLHRPSAPWQRPVVEAFGQPGTFRRNFTREQYKRAVEKALDYIGCGDIYQVNLSQRFECDCTGKRVDPRRVYQTLRNLSPVSFGGYLDCGGFSLMCNSPERFLRLENRMVQTRPMKGTRPRGGSAVEDQKLRKELLNSAKEKAELLMITDLLRNDLGRVCDYGSVRVREMRTIEEYKYVFQATSTIEGNLRQDKDCFDVIRACFPGGSVTGCPKIRAMEIIEELEPTRRGIYTGTMGYIDFDGNMDFNILIRTLLAYRDKLYFQAGGGIVADSTPEREYEETLVKARAMQDSLGTGAYAPIP